MAQMIIAYIAIAMMGAFVLLMWKYAVETDAQQETPKMLPKKVIEGSARNYTEESKHLRFLHLRSKDDPNNAVTIAYRWDRENGVVDYCTARCARGDLFCKKIGREIAKGRYRKYGPSNTLNNIKTPEDLLENFEILWHPDYAVPPGAGSQFFLED